MSPADLAQRIAALDWSGVPLTHRLAVTAAVETLKAVSPAPKPAAACNVVVLPVPHRSSWTALHRLDGTRWTANSHFGPGNAWNWILETVAAEYGVSEDQINCAESGDDQPYGCDDLVTIDGLPVLRIQHFSS